VKLLDLSQPVYDGCPNCPVHPLVSAKVTAQHPADGWHMEQLSLTSHTGSHIDAPLHKVEDGRTIDSFPLETFTGKAVVADLRDAVADQAIDSSLLQSRLPDLAEDYIVLLATGWGQKRAPSDEWHYHSPYLAPDGAEWLVQRKARAVGIDHYSIAGSRDPDNSRTHEILLRAGLWIVEELLLPNALFGLPQPFEFWALPINFKGFSGSFCRPVIVIP
jgi:arylformamidase